MAGPKATVLTAVRNGMPYLPETVSSIQAQTFTDWEYLIVDDASEDGTAEWVAEAARRDARVTLIRRDKQGGPFAAANTGLRHARGAYVVRTDADDLQPPDRIQCQFDFLASHPDLRACISPWHSFNEDGLIPGAISCVPTRRRVLKWYLLLRTFASHSSLCIERAALEQLGGYAELPAAADFRLVSTLTRRGWLGVIPTVLSYVRRHSRRLSGSHGHVQIEMALETMREHLADIAKQAWEREDLRHLWLAGHAYRHSLRLGLEAIQRWSSLWRADRSLDDTDRASLAAFQSYHIWNFIRANVRRQPLAALHYGLAVFMRWPGVAFGARPETYK